MVVKPYYVTRTKGFLRVRSLYVFIVSSANDGWSDNEKYAPIMEYGRRRCLGGGGGERLRTIMAIS